jgi:hypothetical protein
MNLLILDLRKGYRHLSSNVLYTFGQLTQVVFLDSANSELEGGDELGISSEDGGVAHDIVGLDSAAD